MHQILCKLQQVEGDLMAERQKTQKLASDYETLIASRDDQHARDVQLLEGMLAKALKARRHEAGGSTESGGTSSKRSRSRTATSSNPSSTGSRSGDGSAES